MNGPLRLAWKYVLFHKLKSLILIACIVLTAILPIAIKLMVWQFNQKIVARAESTPAVIGAKGSDLDLTLSTLYFKTGSVDPISYSEVAKIREDNLAVAMPIHSMFTALQHPLVGTSLEYFEFRGLRPKSGVLFATIGDCVLGSRVAEEIGANQGDQIISDRDNVLDLAGQSPLKLTVSGVLKESRSPDDWAVFVDLKTAWVIQGLGHGHQDLTKEKPDSPILISRSDGKIVANQGVASYIEITTENIDSFHFHGNLDDFPITSVIAVANDVKDETILEGRYASGSSEVQFARPAVVVRELMSMVFRVNQFFNANAILIAISTALLLILVVLLSLRLRKREMETMFKLGCSRGTIAMLQIGEMGIIFGVALILLAAAVWGVWLVSGDLVESLLVNSK
jgi:putative ABC transport system permease protein